MDVPVTPKAAVLQVLRSGPAYALEISACLAARSPGLTYSHNAVRCALRELERLRLVESEPESAPQRRGGRPRYIYKLSVLGQAAAVEHKVAVMQLFRMEP